MGEAVLLFLSAPFVDGPLVYDVEGRPSCSQQLLCGGKLDGEGEAVDNVFLEEGLEGLGLVNRSLVVTALDPED